MEVSTYLALASSKAVDLSAGTLFFPFQALMKLLNCYAVLCKLSRRVLVSSGGLMMISLASPAGMSKQVLSTWQPKDAHGTHT